MFRPNLWSFKWRGTSALATSLRFGYSCWSTVRRIQLHQLPNCWFASAVNLRHSSRGGSIHLGDDRLQYGCGCIHRSSITSLEPLPSSWALVQVRHISWVARLGMSCRVPTSKPAHSWVTSSIQSRFTPLAGFVNLWHVIEDR